jgi:hypothetical protein
MANQIVISSGAKVRNLNGVLTGTTGVVDALGINVPSGIPQLDGSGKILVSQLPNSVMEYKGTWNAATNTPTLVNGTGNQGDVYLCNVAGTVNFGAGAITFAVGDQAIYSGTIWQKAGGSTGTVTSVAVTETGDALTITGSPITTSGTINIGFAGTSGQYINGAGGLTTFPTLLSSVGLSMPSAFTVTNSPLTANGTIAVTGAGTTDQYVRGDGSLATFPSTAQEAKRLITEVYNSTGATLTKGTVVYINGGQGNLPTVTKALATSDATSAQTYGLVQTDITNNNNGFVVVIGSLMDLDTQAFAAGTQLYLSGVTAGTYTSTKPSAPIHLVYVAIVVRSHPTQGVIEVKIQNGVEMDEIHDVQITSVANGNILQYDSTTSLWKNVAGTTTNIAEGTNLYFTDTRARAAISLTTTGTSGAATYTSGVLNIPNYGSALSGYVPYTGATTNVDLGNNLISSASIQLNGDNTSNFGYLGFKQFISGSSGNTGYTSIYAQSTNKLGISYSQSGGGVKIAVFSSDSIPLNSALIYNLPASNGTLALTSDLSSYLPLSGGTLTGALNINLGSGTGLNVASDLVIFRASTGFATPRQITLAAGNGATTYLEAKGYGANYITDFGIRTYNSSGTAFEVFFATSAGDVGIGNTAPAAKLDVTGTGRFSGNVGVGGATTEIAGFTSLTINNSSSGSFLDLNNSGTNNLRFLSLSSVDQRIQAQGNLRFDTAGSARLSITSGGNVGIGTSSPSRNLVVQNSSSIVLASLVANPSNIAYLLFGDTDADAQGRVQYDNSSDSLQLYSNGSERMRITSGGNVGIGTSAPTDYSGFTTLHLNGKSGANGGLLRLTAFNDSSSVNIYAAGSAINFNTTTAVPYIFLTQDTERMRITSDGTTTFRHSGVGSVGFINSNTTSSGSSVYSELGVNSNNTSSTHFVGAQSGFGNRINIFGNGNITNTNNSYGGISDIRLKENITEATNKLEKLLKVRIVNYNIIGDTQKQIGVIAQELEQVFPSMIDETIDLDKEGNNLGTTTKSVKYSVFVPMLIKAIQELEARIKQLENK